ncbi:DNA-directed RNA polymerase III subunit RPC4-like isoform X1 [Daphnia pulex]|uniref:DNA-directed RNA polymerase III subunit RPC4-like isoform X1 n=1 Tax=Daphnia pulex TaxID=6669 RepID=UPI001EE0CABB|nr:DNA-directed RNA polymerase III subunit RPC4-like isoform X1 [Daphnia pulex]
MSGSGGNPSDLVKKLALKAATSPLNANRSGRLPSLRGERDLSLGGSSRPNLNSVSGAAKPKKEFKPTIPVRRTKTLEAPLNVDNSAESSSNGRGRGGRRDDNRGRGRGRGKEWVQSEGALFGQGVCDSNPKMRSSSSAYADREGGGSSGGLEKPRLNTQNTKVNKEEEDAALSALLRDDFLDDSELGDGFYNNVVMQPIQLPKSSLDASVKEEVDDIGIKSESKPAITVEGGVTIKQEKDEKKPIPTPKASSYQRRLKPSQVTGEHIFQNEGELLFIQLPDVLPSLKSDKERPQVKNEPGTAIQEKVVDHSISEAKPDKESVFEDIPEGRLGTLRIHKSGKITLQMGEHSFVLDSATQVSYLQDLISVEVDAEDKTGKMRALGPIKYKTVCLPDWDELIADS